MTLEEGAIKLSKGQAIEKFLLADNKIFSSPIRLTTMIILHIHKKVAFTELIKLLHQTPGKLDYHIKYLEKEQLVIRKTQLFPHRALIVIEITSKGNKEIVSYLSFLKDVLKDLDGSNKSS